VKIKEFSIRRYGPLPDSGNITLQSFNLFFGKNEEGKTLTIDALVKLLIGKHVKDFENIDRVDESPNGYVIVEDRSGNEVKLTEKRNITAMLDLSPYECRNIFIVRNSDLSIANESNFYTGIADRLTGLRTEEIKKIKDELRDIGKLTPSGSFRNDGASNKLKSKIEKAQQIINKIEHLPEEIDIDELDRTEEESLKYREEINRIISDINDLEGARNREKYEKGREALNKLKESVKRLNELKGYNEDDEQLWRGAEREIRNYEGEKQKLLSELRENEEEFKKISKELKEKERDFKILNERKDALNNDVKPELKIYEKERINIAKVEKKSKSFSFLRISSAALLVPSIIGAIIKPIFVFYILIILFSFLFFISLYPLFLYSKKMSQLSGLFEEIRLILSKYNMSSDTFEGILSNIQKFDDEFQKSSEGIQDTKEEAGILRGKIRDIKERYLPESEKKIKTANKKIDQIKKKSGEDILKDYNEKMVIKKNVDKTILEQKSVLSSIIGKGGGALKENITFWDKELERLEDYKIKALEVKYDDMKVEKLRDEKSQVEEKLVQINSLKKIYQKQLEEIEREANNLLRLESDFLHCRTSTDLQAIKSKLQNFLDESENNRNNVLDTIKIFEEIESEEKEKVTELFGDDNSISKYFSDITDGIYENVLFNKETGKIEVKRKDDKVLEADKLSGGAYDQLYLSIRLALGEKLLKGAKGFFIMDDPFIKSDESRLKRQVKMLKDISKMGWQILYFSAKSEVKVALKGSIKNKTINFIEVKGIYL